MQELKNIMTADGIKIDICICTYKRQQVALTLHSLNHIKRLPEWQIRVIIADNDDMPSARELIQKESMAMFFPITYIHAPARNISLARNACLDEVDGDFAVFIDDDEQVSAQWLLELMAEQSKSGAGVVLGPVQAIYNNDCPPWIKRGNFHATNPVWVDDEIITGYSCNVLMKPSDAALKDLRFRLDLGKSGGEDTFFFAQYTQSGGKISFASEAWVSEEIPDHRAKASWLLQRKFRFGQTHALLLLEKEGGSMPKRARHISIAALKCLYCLAPIPLFIFSKDRLYFWLLRAALHAGVICRLLGKRDLVQYGGDVAR